MYNISLNLLSDKISVPEIFVYSRCSYHQSETLIIIKSLYSFLSQGQTYYIQGVYSLVILTYPLFFLLPSSFPVELSLALSLSITPTHPVKQRFSLKMTIHMVSRYLMNSLLGDFGWQGQLGVAQADCGKVLHRMLENILDQKIIGKDPMEQASSYRVLWND